MKAFTENTKVSISLVLALLGGAAWLTTLYYQTQANADSLKRVEVKQDAYADDLHHIRMDIEGIHGELRRINQ